MVRMRASLILLSSSLILLAALVTAAQSPTTGRLTGTVKDPSGEAIAGTEILAKNSQTGAQFLAVTNGAGVWEILSIAGGKYTVTLRAPGFKKTTFEAITVDAGATATADATLQIGLEDQVVVTASRFEEEVVNAPATATVISEQAIRDLPTQNMADLLRAVPGMNVSQMSAGQTGVTSRSACPALPGTQLVMVDGRTIYLDAHGMAFWELIPASLDEVKQVEVVRGPASAVWGAYAMNGVVNILTKPPREMLGTTFTLGIGTFNRSGGAAESNRGSLFYVGTTHAGALNNRWSFKISAGAYTQNAFARPQGTIPNQYRTPYPTFPNEGTTRPKVDARVDYDRPDGRQHFTFAGGHVRNSGMILGAAGGLCCDSTGSYGKVDYGRGSLRITSYVNRFTRGGKYAFYVSPTGEPIQEGGDSQTYHIEVGDSRMIRATHLIAYGGSFRHTEINFLLMPQARGRNESGAYFQDEILLSKHLRWVAGIRVDKFNFLQGVVLSPRTTLMVKPEPGQTFRVSYNRAYVAPSAFYTDLRLDILSRVDLGLFNRQLAGTYFGFPFRFSGNRDLKEQSLDAYEVGYTAIIAKGRASFGASFYVNDGKRDFGFIQIGSYTSGNPPPGWPLPPSVLDNLIAKNAFGAGRGLPSLSGAYNKSEVRNKGIELNVDARFNRWLAGYANYSWQAKPTGEETDIRSLPPAHRVNAGLGFDNGRYLGNVSLGYVSSAFWNDVLGLLYSGTTQAYALVNVTGGVRWGVEGKYMAMLKVFDLANTRIQNNIYGDILKRQISGEFRVRF